MATGKPAALIHFAFDDTTAIKAISPNDREDGLHVNDRSTAQGWTFDANSVAAAGPGVLVPDLGPGRWIADTTVAGAVAAADLASTANGFGASLVGVEDAGTFTAAATVEDALAELYQHLFSTVGGYIPIPLSALREVNATGDVGDITANGGVLASDTTPIFEAVATSNEQRVLWATGDVDPVGVSVILPRDFDDTADATIDLVVSSGATNDATIVCASTWSAGAAGTEVSDSTSDVATKSATPHTLSITIDKDDIPAGARRMTLRLTPPTHATDAISLYALGIAYKRKPLTS